MTLRTKISLHTTIMITLALCIAGGVNVLSLKTSLRNALFDGLRSSSMATSETIHRFLDDSLREAQAAAYFLDTESIRNRDAGAIQEKLKALAGIFTNFDNGLFILDQEGQLLADYPYHPGSRGYDLSFREYYQRTMKEGVGIISTPYKSIRTGEPEITFTTPLKDVSGNIVGILGCSTGLMSSTASGIIRANRVGDSGYIYVFDKNRMLIIHPDRGRILRNDVGPGINLLFDAAIDNGFSGVGETVNSRGIAMIAAVSQIPGTNWMVMVQQPKEEAYAPLWDALRRILIGIVVACLGCVPVTWLIVRRITGSLLKLREAAVGLGLSVEKVDGNWQEETRSLRDELKGVTGGSEIQDLAAAFTEMCGGLEKTLCSLRQSAEEWENTFKSVPDGILLLDREQRILKINQPARDLTGKGASFVAGMHCYEFMHGMRAPSSGCPHRETVTSGRMVSREIRDAASGRFVKVITTPLHDKDGGITGTVHITRDITHRKVVEETLRQTRDMLHSLIQSAPVAINMTDSERRIVMWNPAAEKLFGWKAEEVIGKPYPMAICEESISKLSKASLAGGIVNSNAAQLRKRDGSPIDVSVSAAPVYDCHGNVFGAMEIIVDITEKLRTEREQKRLENQLRQAHKMEAIGTLAGGIAHDFNNLLSAILGYSELTLQQMPEGEPSRRNIEQILKAGMRARDLVKQIVSFSRKTETRKTVLQLTPIVAETLTLLRASLPATIRIKQELREGENRILADATQVHQVIMNLCTNAAHAMSEKGGTLEIILSRIDADTSRRLELGRRACTRLTVTDTGHGMDRETMERIFDPYFTTKDVGVGGTGLGLAVARGIVKSCGGAIRVASEPGAGSRFDVFFPVVDAEISALPARREHQPGEKAHILLVDDEKYLVDVERRMLEHLGHTVTTRTNGMEALEAFKADPEGFDLVITDTTMPCMTGVELSAEIRRIHEATPIVLCTGFSEMITPEKARAMGIQELVLKPLAMSDMDRIIRRALDRTNSSDGPDKEIESLQTIHDIPDITLTSPENETGI